MPPTVSLRQAAEALGVHYMTAYRYVRLGLLPAVKSGSEWQIAEADVAAFRKPAVPGHRSGTRWDERFEARILAGDLVGSWSVLEGAMAAGTEPVDVHDRVIAPAMRSVGLRWERREISVADEHRASAVVQRVLGRLSHQMVRRGRSKGVVVTGTAVGERHGLPVLMVADLLRAHGWDTIDLGCDLPAESFVDAVAAASGVVAIVVSATAPDNDLNVQATVQALRRAHPDVSLYLGGGAIESEDRAVAFGATGWADSAGSLVREL